MLKQRRSARQPRTAGSGGHSEFDASPASRDIFSLPRTDRSEPKSSDGGTDPGMLAILRRESVWRETYGAEDERRIRRLDRESSTKSRIPSWPSDRDDQDDYDETDLSERPFNHIYNPTQTQSPFQDSSDKHPRAVDIFEIVRSMRRGKQRERQRHALEQLTRQRFEVERFWRAENHERPRAHLYEMYSLSSLHNKDTISRDNTTGTEAGMDDLLACVGKMMMKTAFLEESRDESSKIGEGLEGDAMGSGIHIPRAKPPADLGKLHVHPRLGKGYQINSQQILPRGNNYQPVRSIAELGESEDKFEHSTTTPSPRSIWAHATPRRLSTRPTSVGPEWEDISDDEDGWLRASRSRDNSEVDYERQQRLDLQHLFARPA